MTEPGERRPRGATIEAARRASTVARLRPHGLATAMLEALMVALLAAVAWAIVKGILESAGVLAVAALGGWAIGALLWTVRARPVVAAFIAALAWVVGLMLTWLLAMATLPGSTRTFLERVEGTPFLDWLGPQFGFIEIAGLVVYIGASLYGARTRD